MSQQITFDWQLRLSKRAKRPRITISTHGVVELVWPHRMSQRHTKTMLLEHSVWVHKQLASINVQQMNNTPPQTIHFSAIHQEYTVEYQQQDGRIHFKTGDNKLAVVGNIEDEEALRYVLNAWVKQQGKVHLSPWLADVAQEMGVSYKQVSIRLQKKRWGSCSTQGNINLNAALLFLPDYLVRHVLIHELTHLKHHNHSAAFWSAVEKFEPEYKKHRKLLKQLGMKVPDWLTIPFTYDLHKPSKG